MTLAAVHRKTLAAVHRKAATVYGAPQCYGWVKGGAPLGPGDVHGAPLCPSHVPPLDTLKLREPRAVHGARYTVGARHGPTLYGEP